MIEEKKLTEEDLLWKAQAVLEARARYRRKGSCFCHLVRMWPQLAAQQSREPLICDGCKAIVLQAITHILLQHNQCRD